MEIGIIGTPNTNQVYSIAGTCPGVVERGADQMSAENCLLLRVANAADSVVNADDIALRAASAWKVAGITVFRIAALCAGAMNVHQSIFTAAGRILHPAGGFSESNINGGFAVPGSVEVGGAAPVPCFRIAHFKNTLINGRNG